jgi:hypothetical protein
LAREFLTGFRKRKLEKKKCAKEKYERLVRQEKAEKRKEVATEFLCPNVLLYRFIEA